MSNFGPSSDLPAESNVLDDDTVGGEAGTFVNIDESLVASGEEWGDDGTEFTGTLGADLLTNGDFETGDFTGWDEHDAELSIVSNACQIDDGGGAAVYLGQDFDVVFGRTYNITYEITTNTGIDSTELIMSDGSAFGSSVLVATVGVHSISLEVTNASPTYDFRIGLSASADPGDTITIDNITVRDVDVIVSEGVEEGIFFYERRK